MANDSSYGRVLSLPRRSLAPARGRALQHIAQAAALTDVHPAGGADGAATGFVLSLLGARAEGPVLWVQDRASRRENGRVYLPGLRGFRRGHAILQITVSHPRDVLWAMEEGAACSALAAVVGEIHGAPAALSFTATQRLAIRAEASGVPVYLIRSGDPGGLSAARMRWRLASLPSDPHPHDTHASGALRWDADLFRARGHAPGRWVACYDPDAPRPADRFRLVPHADDGAVDPDRQPASDAAGS